MIVCISIAVVLMVGYRLLQRYSLWEQIKNPYRVLLVFSVLGILAGIAQMREENNLSDGKILRSQPGEGSVETELKMVVPEAETEYAISLELEEKILTKKEEQEKIAAAIEEIEAGFCGENTSLENIVTDPLVLESYQQELVTAEWDFSEEYISNTGEIDTFALGNEKCMVEAKVYLTCGESSGEYRFCFWLSPAFKTVEERLREDVKRQIAEQKPTEEIVVLPDMADGKRIFWEEKKKNRPLEIAGIGVLAAVAYAYALREAKFKKVQKRKRVLLLEYPEFVSKLSLLLGAGMNLQTAFRKINQMQKKTSIKKEEIVYQELQQMLYEIDNGMGEIRAYQKFAERCDLQPYRKLVSLLQSGQKLGNRELTERLQEEADRVFAERKNTARKLGEEASTKLLVPMMMMLVIVMGIVIFPAFLSIYNM